MRKRYRLLFMVVMTLAIGFGFLDIFFAGEHNFERLHIFLFNLTSGGTSILYFIENEKKMTQKTRAFLLLSILFAVLVWLEFFFPAVILGLTLAAIAESVREKRFSFFPAGFFKTYVPTSDKFAQASLLCLVLALLTAVVVIIDNTWLHLFEFKRLTIDTFFLGFSFPVSLITMSVMFSLIPEKNRPFVTYAGIFAFWSVNLGVIFFFLFITLGWLLPQVAVSTLLFITIFIIFGLFARSVSGIQQKNFLVSGMVFLLYTAVTGIVYILLEIFSGSYPANGELLLRLHSFASLYGWNLSGLAVIYRRFDFPIRLNSKMLITSHWLLVALAAPLGSFSRPIALIAIAGYGIFLYLMFFSGKKSALTTANGNIT